jgi:hypothetical protein
MTIPLDPADALTVTTLVDNVLDLLLVDQGPAQRPPFALVQPQAHRDGAWQPDPLILDDQALVAHVRGRGLVLPQTAGRPIEISRAAVA